jgi:hypothetical protein
MSLLDDTFSPIPGPLLREWGQTVSFHKTGGNRSYDPASGNILYTTTTYTALAVVTRVQAAELSGTLQTTDYKVLIAPSEIGGNYITTADSFSFTRGARTIRAKVVDVTSYEGEAPIMFTVFVRPQ